MPARAPRPCRHPNCHVLVRSGGYCAAHRSERARGISTNRAEALRFYTSRRWRSFRALVLSGQPLCVECQRNGRIEPATELDHIVPRRLRPDLAFEIANVQGLCKSHHSRKTRRGA